MKGMENLKKYIAKRILSWRYQILNRKSKINNFKNIKSLSNLIRHRNCGS